MDVVSEHHVMGFDLKEEGPGGSIRLRIRDGGALAESEHDDGEEQGQVHHDLLVGHLVTCVFQDRLRDRLLSEDVNTELFCLDLEERLLVRAVRILEKGADC